MSCARLRYHAHVQSHKQGSEVSLRGLRGHFLHTVIFLVAFILDELNNLYFATQVEQVDMKNFELASAGRYCTDVIDYSVLRD